MADTAVADLKGGHLPAQKVIILIVCLAPASYDNVQVGGVRVVSRGTPKQSESDKNENAPSAEDVEEFGEDKEEKKNTNAIVSGAKTGNL